LSTQAVLLPFETAGQLFPKLIAALEATGIAVVREFPVDNDSMLIRIGSELGFVSTRGNGNPRKKIYLVTADYESQQSKVLSSRTSGEFAIHTDSCSRPKPHA
jgi:hypothetical protein